MGGVFTARSTKASGNPGAASRASSTVTRLGVEERHGDSRPEVSSCAHAAVALRGAPGYEWVLGLSGGISILFGYFIVIWPRAGAVAVVAYVAGYAILTGVLLVAAGFRQRRWRAALDRIAVIGAS